VGSLVRVRGTAAEAHNKRLRQLISVDVYVPVPGDFIVEVPESADPFNQPIVPLSSLGQYHADNSFNHRVHVKGVVTLQRLGECLFLKDSTGGLQARSSELAAFSVGETVEAVGFPNFENYLPVLQDSVFRKTGESPTVLIPEPALTEDLEDGLHHAGFVSLEGKLISRTVKHIGPLASAVSRTTLALQNDNLAFVAEADGPPQNRALEAIPLGSSLRVSGICLSEIDSDGRMKTFRLLIPGPENVRVLAQPSWFTPQRLLMGLAALGLVLLVIVRWTLMVSQKNSALKVLVQERERAQTALQQAHDFLEERVKERTAQVKLQITARKESELQSKAVLAERTRLAQELHDTLEQSLTGISLQLDTTAKLFEKNPAGAHHHLDTARNLMAQSQVEVRRSVWDLRCRALEVFDLPGALLRSARQINDGTGLQVELKSKGRVRPLPEIVEENLLRIGQEAITNVVKHSNARNASIELDFGSDRVVLRVQDDGRGFTPGGPDVPINGHFGLLGMSERAKRLGGKVWIESSPGSGTAVRVEIPLEAGLRAPSYLPNGEPSPVTANAATDSDRDDPDADRRPELSPPGTGRAPMAQGKGGKK
jgi:signal transduction histidine kinase